jgi:putative spermidine/putrescine transport system substrate-binding protein
MVNRRSFLQGITTLALAQGLSACGTAENAPSVIFLDGSIPPRLRKDFRNTIKEEIIQFKSETNLKNLLNILEKWREKSPDAPSFSLPIPFREKPTPPRGNLVTLGDSWLASAIAQGLLEPLDPARFSQWEQLPPQWRAIVRRDPQGLVDETGAVWGAPYRWGSVAIAYNEEKFRGVDWRPRDWSDLWQREKLRGQIALPDDPREVIGLTLKKLGHSYNTTDLDQVPALKSALRDLQERVKFYSSEYYLQSLIVGDVWLAVGWSDDIIPVTERYPEIKMVVPASGSSLWSDIWVKPAKTTKNALVEQWIDFCWQTEAADRISLLTDGLSPLLLTRPENQIPADIRNDPLLQARGAIEKSEFLYPLPVKVQKELDRLWQDMRRSI